MAGQQQQGQNNHPLPHPLDNQSILSGELQSESQWDLYRALRNTRGALAANLHTVSNGDVGDALG